MNGHIDIANFILYTSALYLHVNSTISIRKFSSLWHSNTFNVAEILASNCSFFFSEFFSNDDRKLFDYIQRALETNPIILRCDTSIIGFPIGLVLCPFLMALPQ